MFLGTAASEGWPAVFCQCQYCIKAREIGGKNLRSRASVLFNDDLKVDFPPDTYMHVLKYGLDLGALKFLLVTHSHRDHFYADDLETRRSPFAYIKCGDPLKVYGNETVYEKTVKVAPPEVVSPEIIKPFKPLKLDYYEVEALPADHARSEECLLYVISIGDVSVFYGHDSGWYPDETWKALKRRKLSLIIMDCTCIIKNCVNYHMGIETMVKAKNRMISEGIADGNTIFIATHFSHNGELLHHELEEKLKPYNITPAYDGMCIKL
jgi:phosphoribosyl 1,2-cyclic phosphate phosphodiesterase